MKRLTVVLLMAVSAIALTSCMTTRTNANGYAESQGQTYKYDRAKQCYLFWGLIPLGRAKAHTPENRPFQVRTYYNFGDALVSTILGGLFEMQTIKVMAKRTPDDQDYFKVGDEVSYRRGGKYHRGEIVSLIDGLRCTVKDEDDGKVHKVKFENMSK